jgi:hypothetical protein
MLGNMKELNSRVNFLFLMMSMEFHKYLHPNTFQWNKTKVQRLAKHTNT